VELRVDAVEAEATFAVDDGSCKWVDATTAGESAVARAALRDRLYCAFSSKAEDELDAATLCALVDSWEVIDATPTEATDVARDEACSSRYLSFSSEADEEADPATLRVDNAGAVLGSCAAALTGVTGVARACARTFLYCAFSSVKKDERADP